MMARPADRGPEFLQGLAGQLLVNEPMSRHTTWRTGGTAQYFYTPADRQDLLALLARLPGDIPVHWVGLGSNLLVRDGGLSGIVIRTAKGLNEITVHSGRVLYAESGVSCAKIARRAAQCNLTGVEFLAGVPGSFGGALAMNAGAFSGETWQWVKQVEWVDRSGNISIHPSAEVRHAYREVELPAETWILGGWLALEKAGPGYRGRDRIRDFLDRRAASQPVQSANAGSVFRNPAGDFAARLIEEAGLKGRESGDAVISPVHSNFIINRGRATSADIENLIRLARNEVRRCSGIELETEVRIIGEAA
ncbi:MAG: UDP-N-acetylmuramate dehydrogenase [Gammaproteobacteria bacterium]|nr:UDP-N-acetylmuramate dehydrogenase [Gammaproteobacteria bacterium]